MIEIVIGIISGFVSAMGMGGGTILILCLTLFLGYEQHIAQASNLVFFIPTSLVAIYMNLKNKMIDYTLAMTVAIPGVLGAILGSFLSIQMDSTVLRKCFGAFLGMIALHEIYSYRKQYIKSKKETY